MLQLQAVSKMVKWAQARPFASAAPFDSAQDKLRTGETPSFGAFLRQSGFFSLS